MDAPIITLTTDWGDHGFFAGMVKGALYSRINNVRVVDINHNIEAFNIRHASFIVHQACPTFPEGTIHIIDVASTPTAEHPFVVIRAADQYYICCDNGLPSAALGSSIDEAYELVLDENGLYNFAAYDVFVPVAAAIIGGTPIHELGPLRKQMTYQFQPTFIALDEGNNYQLYVHHIDSYGNIYLGMTYEEFRRLQGKGNRKFTLQVRDKRFHHISKSYAPDPQGDGYQCLTVSATGLLEVALCGSSFLNLVGGIKIGSSVLLTFE